MSNLKCKNCLFPPWFESKGTKFASSDSGNRGRWSFFVCISGNVCGISDTIQCFMLKCHSDTWQYSVSDWCISKEISPLFQTGWLIFRSLCDSESSVVINFSILYHYLWIFLCNFFFLKIFSNWPDQQEVFSFTISLPSSEQCSCLKGN